MSENANAEPADDTEGHRVFFDEAPTAAEEDDDDTQGHRVFFDEAPSVSGAISIDPKMQS